MTEENKQNYDDVGQVFQSKFGLNIKDMFNAGLCMGRVKSKWNPKMSPYIYTTRNGIRIIDLEKTISKFEEALDFIKKSLSEGKRILFVGTRTQDKEIVKDLANKFKMPFINNRWVGGLFTNFKIISKRLQYYRDLERNRNSGELDKYTKKERLIFDKELGDLEKFMGGIKSIEKVPDGIFIFDTVKDHYALKEARKGGVPIIAINNTDSNPTLCDFPIPAGNNSFTALNYIAGKIEKLL
jgi:small subunit ribosomal protein S2